MLKLLGLAAAASLTAAAAQAAMVVPTNIYQLSGGLSEERGGPAMSVGTGASYTGSGPSQGLRFASNHCPSSYVAVPKATVYVANCTTFNLPNVALTSAAEGKTYSSGGVG